MEDRKIVLLEWIDSKGVTSDWEFLDHMEPMTPGRIKSVGFIMEETNEYITIVQSVSTDQVLARMTIPTCAIINRIGIDNGMLLYR